MVNRGVYKRQPLNKLSQQNLTCDQLRFGSAPALKSTISSNRPQLECHQVCDIDWTCFFDEPMYRINLLLQYLLDFLFYFTLIAIFFLFVLLNFPLKRWNIDFTVHCIKNPSIKSLFNNINVIKLPWKFSNIWVNSFKTQHSDIPPPPILQYTKEHTQTKYPFVYSPEILQFVMWLVLCNPSYKQKWGKYLNCRVVKFHASEYVSMELPRFLLNLLGIIHRVFGYPPDI